MSQYFLAASGPYGNDNGFGFGKGSTDGVINTYGHRGFARPQRREYSTEQRDNLNMRACMGAYACHFDPAPSCCKEEDVAEMPQTPQTMQPKKSRYYLTTVAAIILVVIFVFYFATKGLPR